MTASLSNNCLILVTGGAGFIGSHLVQALLARSYRVRVLDNLVQGQRSYLPEHPALEFVEGDVTDFATCRDMMAGVDAIFHLAAMSKVSPSLAEPDMVQFCTQQNVVGTENMLRAALRVKDRVRKFIYAASSTYYGRNDPPHQEDQKPGWQTPYALTKCVGEQYCELFTRLHGLPTLRLRYFMTFGPREPSAGAYAIVTGVFMKKWLQGEPLPILGDGLQTRDFIHVEDIAEGNIAALESEVTDATVNIGTGKSLSIQELADTISPNQVHLPARVPDIRHQQADVTRMRSLLRWQPRHDLLTYLRDVIRRTLAEQPGRYAAPAWYEAESGR